MLVYDQLVRRGEVSMPPQRVDAAGLRSRVLRVDRSALRMTHSLAAAGGAGATAAGNRWYRLSGYLMLVPGKNRNGLTESKPISSIKHSSMVEFSGGHHRSPREGQGHHQG